MRLGLTRFSKMWRQTSTHAIWALRTPKTNRQHGPRNPSGSGNPLRYRPEIDGLRAVAVIPVILLHAGFDLFSGGFVGVDIFFVISGFLITTIISSALDVEKFSLLSFYERRARRILPALYLVLLACSFYALFFQFPFAARDLSQSIFATTVFAENILLLIETNDYFDLDSELKPLLHTWSLAVEEQYYLIFPLSLIILWRLGKKSVYAILAGVGLFSLGLSQWAAYAYPSLDFYLLPTRVRNTRWRIRIFLHNPGQDQSAI